MLYGMLGEANESYLRKTSEPLEKRIETSKGLIEKQYKKQYCLLFNVNLILLELNKILSIRFNDDFVRNKKI